MKKTFRRAVVRTLVTGLSALWLTASAQSAFAAEPAADVKSMRVFYGDLDLSKEAGAKTLYSRLQRAARSVCGPYYTPYPAGKSWQRCYQDALAEAVEKVNRPQLAALHEKAAKRVQS